MIMQSIDFSINLNQDELDFLWFGDRRAARVQY